MTLRSYFMYTMCFLFWVAGIGGLFYLARIRWSSDRDTLYVLAWQGTFIPSVVKDFERRYGVRVKLGFYASNEELLVKLRSGGCSQYDLVVPSDYAVRKLINRGLVKKIDKSRLNFWPYLNPVLLGHDFDPDNAYSIPFEWEIYLLAYDTQQVAPSFVRQYQWDLVFADTRRFASMPLVMVNDPVEAVAFAYRYLYGTSSGEMGHSQKQTVVDLLQRQRQRVAAYTGMRADYLVGTHNVACALAPSSDVWNTLHVYPTMEYCVPDPTFVTIENCVIPTNSQKEDHVYTFLNHMLSKASYHEHFAEQKFCPARLDVIQELPATAEQKRLMASSPGLFARYHFVTDKVPEHETYDMWTQVKAF